jgi:hypothetical protein
MDIATFLSHTRSNKNEVAEFLPLYTFIFGHLAPLFANAGLPTPELVVISSWQRSCEIVELHGRTYLVYDQYLGQTLNTLNRIFFNSTDRQDAEVYGLKLVGEYAHLQGRPDLAATLLGAHSKLREKHQTYREEIDGPARVLFTMVQECFITAHEYMHLFFSHHPSPSFFKAAREFLIEDFESAQDPDPEEGAAEFLNDMYLALEHRGAEVPPKRGTREFENIMKRLQRDQEEFRRRQTKLLQSRDDLIEEFACDTKAAEITYGAMRELGIPQPIIVDALFAGLLHLRAIAIAERYARDLVNLTGSTRASSSFFYQSLTRVSAFRRHFAAVLNRPRRMRIQNAVHQRFVSVNHRHSFIISDPVIFALEDRLTRFHDHARTMPVLSVSESIRLRNELENLMYVG